MRQEGQQRVKLLDEVTSLVRVARLTWQLVPWEHRLLLGSASLLIAFISLGNVSVAMMLGWLVDRVKNAIETQVSSPILSVTGDIFIALAVIYSLREVLNVARRTLVESSCTRLNCDMQDRVVNHVMKFDLQALASEQLGTLHGKLFRSVDGMIHFVRLLFVDCLPAFFTGTFAIAAAVYKQPILGAIMIGVIPISLWLTMRQLNSQKRVRLELMRDCEQIDGVVVEQLAGVEYIRVSNTYDIEAKRLRKALETRREREIRHHFHMALYGSAKAINEGTFHILVLGLATYMASLGKISVGDVLTFSVLFLNVMAPLNEIHRVIDEGHESSLRLNDLLQLLGTSPDPSFSVPEPSEAREFDLNQPMLQLENVCAFYHVPDGEARKALDKVSISIQRGETIGIAGHSGSGKTTFVKLLMRLLHPASGTIKFHGVDISEVDRDRLAKTIGYVGQTPFVFRGTVEQNICYGGAHKDKTGMEQAAEMANLHDDVMQLLGGYQALVAERGINLSGGQKQRIAIARVLYKDSPLLILDEATSALDNISERKVQTSLGLGTGRRTMLVLAHRLSTLRECDRILVFEKGRIVESGTYDELLEQDGIFAALVQAAEKSALAPAAH